MKSYASDTLRGYDPKASTEILGPGCTCSPPTVRLRSGSVEHLRLDQSSRYHQRPAHHGEVPAESPGVIVSRNGRAAGESAIPCDHREELARQAKQCLASRPRIRTTLPGSTAVLNPWGPGLTRIVSGNRKVRRTGYSTDGGSGVDDGRSAPAAPAFPG
jgi:hypothetical protein